MLTKYKVTIVMLWIFCYTSKRRLIRLTSKGSSSLCACLSQKKSFKIACWIVCQLGLIEPGLGYRLTHHTNQKKAPFSLKKFISNNITTLFFVIRKDFFFCFVLVAIHLNFDEKAFFQFLVIITIFSIFIDMTLSKIEASQGVLWKIITLLTVGRVLLRIAGPRRKKTCQNLMTKQSVI